MERGRRTAQMGKKGGATRKTKTCSEILSGLNSWDNSRHNLNGLRLAYITERKRKTLKMANGSGAIASLGDGWLSEP
jgi:hypothetical protein